MADERQQRWSRPARWHRWSVALVLYIGIAVAFASFLNAAPFPEAWIVLAAGLGISVMLALFVAVHERDRARIERAHREWEDAIDTLQDPVFLHDRKGCLMRANRAYAKRAGLAYTELLGKPYWTVFPKGDGPLPGCSGQQENEPATAQESTAEKDDVVLEDGTTFLSRAYAIRDNRGRHRYSIHTMEDVTTLRRAEEELRYRAEMEKTLRRISTRFMQLSTDGLDKRINAALQEVGVLANADRCYLFQISTDGERMNNTHEWCADGIPPQMPELHDLPTADFKWLMEQLSLFEPLLVPNVADLPLELTERRYFEAGGIRSLMLVPMVFHERLKGFLGFDATHAERDWQRQSIHLLQVTATITAAAIARRDAEYALRRFNRILITTNHASMMQIQATTEEELFEGICKIVVREGGFQAAWVTDTEADGVRTEAFAGDLCEGIPSMVSRWVSVAAKGSPPCVTAIRTGQTQTINDLSALKDTTLWRDDLQACGIEAIIALPLLAGGKPFASFNVCSGESHVFDDAIIAHLQKLAADISYSIRALRTTADRDRAQASLGKTLLQIIEAAARISEMRDPYTAGHQKLVAVLAVAIAAEMNLAEWRIEGIRMGALVHDIGKVALPAEILTRPGRLSELEFEMIKTHPQIGYDIMRGVDFPWPVREMILQHHERIDGSGYPHGLCGDEILLESRILAVADVVEAITSHRPYRPALDMDVAVAELREYRGTRYDPPVVDAFLRLLDSGRLPDLELDS